MLREAPIFVSGYRVGMRNPKDNTSPQIAVRWFLQEWREKAGLTQAQLAERMDTSPGMISDHENGTRRFNEDWMARWAAALNIQPIDLLRNPEDVDTVRAAQDSALMGLLAQIPAEKQEEAARFLRFLLSQSAGK